MKSLVGICTLILLCISPVLGQGKCDLKLEKAPTLRGLQLGMTIEKLLDLIPGSRLDSEITATLRNGREQFLPERVNLHFFSGRHWDRNLFDGIGNIQIGAFDDRVIEIYVSYRQPTWENPDEFISIVAKTLGLPEVQDWGDLNSGTRAINCRDFLIVATASMNRSNPSWIRMVDLTAEARIKARQKEVLVNARKNFKP
jgi:hypothetical protein